MNAATFLFYNITGGIGWVTICMGAGYLFGNVPVIKNNFTLVTIGIVVGLGAALAMSRFAGRLLYDVAASDPLTFAAVTIVLALVAFAACYVPARRATRFNPVVALRYE